MINALALKISERKAELAALDARRIILEAEIRAYEDAYSLISSGIHISSQGEGQTVSSVRLKAGQWTELLKAMALRHPAPFDLDELVSAAGKIDFHPSRGNIRSQMAALVNRGTLSRVGQGAFRFTDEGIKSVNANAVRDEAHRQTETLPFSEGSVNDFEQDE